MAGTDPYVQLIEKIKTRWKELFGWEIDPYFFIQISGLTYFLRNIDYQDLNPLGDTTVDTLDHFIWRNESETEDVYTWNPSGESKAIFTYEATSGFKMGMKFTVNSPVTGFEVSMEVSFQEKTSQTKSISRNWSSTAELKIPPWSIVEGRFMIREGVIDTPFEAIIEARGSDISLWFVDIINMRFLTFTDGFEYLLSPEDRTFHVSGKFTASLGLFTYIEKTQTSLINRLARMRAFKSLPMLREQSSRILKLKEELNKKIKPEELEKLLSDHSTV